MTTKEQIDIILQKRKTRAEHLQEKKRALERICGLLDDCDGLYNSSKSIKDSELRKKYMAIFAELPSDEIRDEIAQVIEQIDKGIQRFSREYISIATVGKERQGKSRFLQAVGNLDNKIIPAYDATSCTGATSVIYNRPDMPVTAVIHFRKREKLLEIVRGYLDVMDPSWSSRFELDFNKLGSKLFDNMINAIEIEVGDAERGTAREHLLKILEHFNEIKALYGREKIVLSDPDEIARHVAQNNGKSITDPECEAYYKYLAVEKAEIYCPFYTDCGKLVLVDTIGLLDTQYGIEEAMLDTVDKECDAAIVVTMPNSGVQDPDLKLYNSLRERFRRRDMTKWLFYLANKKKGTNANAVASFTEQINKGIKDGTFSIAFCETIDCSNEDMVRDKFLMPLLDSLIKNMDDIDAAYMGEIVEAETKAYSRFSAFVESLPEVKTYDPGIAQGMIAYQKGKECYKKLSTDLLHSVKYWSQERNHPNSILWNGVQEIFDNLDELVPSAQILQQTINGSLLPASLWDDALHYVRNEITDRFIAIDSVLEEETRKFKNSLVRSLYDELINLSKNQDSDNIPWTDEDSEDKAEADMVEWLKNMMDHVINDKPQYEQIYKAFRFMYRFEFNTRAQLIQEVRKQLYIINPICDREYARPVFDFHYETAGKEVNYFLTSRMSIIEENLRHVLVDLYRSPNQAFYAAAEEFYDRLTFANSLNGSEFQSMQDVWGSFFMEYSRQLWTENSEKYNKVNELVEEYKRTKELLIKEGAEWRP